MNRGKRIGRISYASSALVLLAVVAWPSAAGALDCVSVTDDAIKQLFVLWNNALKAKTPDGRPDPNPVVALYAPKAVLLPTVEVGPYGTPELIKGYFDRFLKDGPSGDIDDYKRTIRIGCNMAFDVGLYTFTYTKPGKKPTKARYTYVYEYQSDAGKWLIAHHHSSVDPPPPPQPRPRK